MSNNSAKQFTSPILAMGHQLPDRPERMINETATRARAGLLNFISSLTIFILLAHPEWDPIRYVAPFVIFDMVTAASFGLTPLSPTGLLGTLLTMRLKPVWSAVKPKRFAWSLGAFMGCCCLTFWLLELSTPWLLSVLGICFLLTWLEGIMGFCVGCWMYNGIFGCDPCSVEEIS